MMEAENTSETSVNSYQTTWLNKPEDNHVYIIYFQNILRDIYSQIVSFCGAS
jgi:hypothetical protein